MRSAPRLAVKLANEPWEFEQVYALNHRTFVEEIPRYASAGNGRLVDRFHSENTYVIALRGERLAGMVAVRGTRPFSVDERVADIDRYLPRDRAMCELRLLAVDRRERRGRVLPALLAEVWQYCLGQGFDLALISGITKQLPLYRRLGFEPFGPVVGTPEAQFQPMMLTLERFAPRAREVLRAARPERPTAIVNLLPGPVSVREHVQRAFERRPESHRSAEFVERFQTIKQSLCALVHATHVEILLGSGTSANDAVAAQLSREPGSGLIVSNGEFGDRLVDHARRFGLRCEVVRLAWGRSIDFEDLERRLCSRRPAWLWVVHCETSTGVLNDVDRLRALCQATGVKLCLDAISSIGTVPLNLTGVFLASGSSSKGLGAYPGLSMVFHHHDIAPAPDAVPRYLDLGLYARERAVPFTQSSNLADALAAAVDGCDWDARFAVLADRARWLRARLERLGFTVVAPAFTAAPGVTTVALPPGTQAACTGAELERRGFLVSAYSEYLTARNWIQISLMSEPAREQLAEVTAALADICGEPFSEAAPARC